MTEIITVRQRRQALRDAIARHGPEHFHMGYWFRTLGIPSAFLMDGADHQIDITECGTTACLAGHGVLVMVEAGAEVDPECPVRSVADWFELSTDSFFHGEGEWGLVCIDGDTLDDVYARHREMGVEHREAEYLTVLALLDHLIATDDPLTEKELKLAALAALVQDPDFCAAHIRIERDNGFGYVRCGECWHLFTKAELVLRHEELTGTRKRAENIHTCPECAHDF